MYFYHDAVTHHALHVLDALPMAVTHDKNVGLAHLPPDDDCTSFHYLLTKAPCYIVDCSNFRHVELRTNCIRTKQSFKKCKH